MTESARLLGPRGWAALILASGAALSAPFLRNPNNTPPDEQPTVGTLPQVAATPSTWPDLHERSLTPPQSAANLTEQDWAELSRLQKISGASPRKVTGELPSTSGPSRLPAWADRGPRIDQVVEETLVTDSLPPLADAGVTPATQNSATQNSATQNSATQNSANQNSALEPFRPWMGDGLKSKADAPAIAESSANDFAMAHGDPDARWSNAPNSTHAGFSGATTSNGSLVRKFENKVAQWPDEIVAPPQFFEQSRQQALASRDATRPNVNWPSTAGSTQPLSGPGIGQIVNVPIRQSLGNAPSQLGTQDQETATAQIILPNSNLQNAAVMPPAFALQPTLQPTAPIQPSVTAPMISSQSGRPPNRPLDPSIEATKPKSDAPRPKHFIQQPTKRA